MAYIAFTARRSLVSGVTAGDPINFLINLQMNDESVLPKKTEHISLGGRIVTRVDRINVNNEIKTEPVTTDDKNGVVKMFLDSVVAGETFAMNLNGNSSSGQAYYKIVGTYQKNRIYQDIFEYSFKVVAV